MIDRDRPARPDPDGYGLLVPRAFAVLVADMIASVSDDELRQWAADTQTEAGPHW